MKKEFNAPTVEIKLLSTQNSVMNGIFTSAGKSPDGLSSMKDEAVSGYEQWKGFN